MNRSIDRTPQAQSARHSPARRVQFDSEPFAEQLELSRIHPQLVPMRRHGVGYAIDPSAECWRQLPNERGFAGFGSTRGMRMLLDVLAGLRALHQTHLDSGVAFAHGEVAPLNFRMDPRGVCRLVPLTMRHSVGGGAAVPHAALGYLSPERLIGQQVGVRGDVFSIGILLWEALACRRLFNERNPQAIIERMLRAEIEPPDVPAHCSWASPLQTQLSQALKVDQARRQVDCNQLAEVIAGVALDRLPSHGELAAFFGGMGSPRSSTLPPAPAAPAAVLAELADGPSESATFSRLSVPGAQRMPLPAVGEPVEQHSAPLRFMTVRMSAVQLRRNGLFDSDDPSATDGSENFDHPPAALPLTATPSNVAAPKSSAPPRSGSPPRRTSPPPPLPAVIVAKPLPLTTDRSDEAALRSVAPLPSGEPSVADSPLRKPAQPPPLRGAAVAAALPDPVPPRRPRPPPPPPRRRTPPPPLPVPLVPDLVVSNPEPVFAERTAVAPAVFAERAAAAPAVFAERAAVAPTVFAERAAVAQPAFAERAAVAQPAFAERAAVAQPAFAERAAVAQPAFAESAALAKTVFDETAAISQPVVAETAEPAFAAKSTHRSPLNLLGWSALAGLLIGVVIAGIFAKRTGESARQPGVDRRAASGMPAVDSPIAAPDVGPRPATTNEGGTQAAHEASAPAPKPSISPRQNAASRSEPATRRAPNSAVPARPGSAHSKDYGI